MFGVNEVYDGVGFFTNEILLDRDNNMQITFCDGLHDTQASSRAVGHVELLDCPPRGDQARNFVAHECTFDSYYMLDEPCDLTRSYDVTGIVCHMIPSGSESRGQCNETMTCRGPLMKQLHALKPVEITLLTISTTCAGRFTSTFLLRESIRFNSPMASGGSPFHRIDLATCYPTVSQTCL